MLFNGLLVTVVNALVSGKSTFILVRSQHQMPCLALTVCSVSVAGVSRKDTVNLSCCYCCVLGMYIKHTYM